MSKARSAPVLSSAPLLDLVPRIYDPQDHTDGYRVLIDHIWPRGVSREHARLDEWARELAPSDELRKWFDHSPARFAEFRASLASLGAPPAASAAPSSTAAPNDTVRFEVLISALPNEQR